MIDEKKLIDSLSYDISCFDTDDKKDNQMFIRVDDMIRMIQGQPKTGGWVPCSERLPKESLESVIGWDEYSERCCFVQFWGGRWILGDDTESVKIVAWMPLPEPYKAPVPQYKSNFMKRFEKVN